MAYTTFPNDAICYILADIPGQGEFQGSGVIIGPHTILTAAHLLYDAGTDATADKVSVYPGFTPENGTYNPPGALPGLQSIHTIKVQDAGDKISPAGTQSDFAIINTSTDLSRYGKFALDPDFITGDVVASGYPASGDGNQSGLEGVVSQDGARSDLLTSNMGLSPGYSGGPLRDNLYRDGAVIPAVVGLVSTNIDAMKLNRPKALLIRHWIASDQSLYAGGSFAPRGLVPQIDGTVSGTGEAAAVSASADLSSPAATGGDALDPHAAAVDLVTGSAAAEPIRVFHPGQGYGIDS